MWNNHRVAPCWALTICSLTHLSEWDKRKDTTRDTSDLSSLDTSSFSINIYATHYTFVLADMYLSVGLFWLIHRYRYLTSGSLPLFYSPFAFIDVCSNCLILVYAQDHLLESWKNIFFFTSKAFKPVLQVSIFFCQKKLAFSFFKILFSLVPISLMGLIKYSSIYSL